MLNTIIPDIVAAISALVPTVEPDTTFVPAYESAQLLHTAFGSLPEAASRRFQVTAGIVEGRGGPTILQIGLGQIHLKDEVVVAIKYHIPQNDSFISRASSIIGTDAAEVINAVASITLLGHDSISRIDPTGTATVDTEGDIIMVRIPFIVQYWIQQ